MHNCSMLSFLVVSRAFAGKCVSEQIDSHILHSAWFWFLYYGLKRHDRNFILLPGREELRSSVEQLLSPGSFQLSV